MERKRFWFFMIGRFYLFSKLFCIGYLLDWFASRIVGGTVMLGLWAVLWRHDTLQLLPGYLLSFLPAAGTQIYMFRIGTLILHTRPSLLALLTEEPYVSEDHDFVHVGIPAVIYVGFMYSLNPLNSIAFVLWLARACVQGVIERIATIHLFYAGGLVMFIVHLISLCADAFNILRNPVFQVVIRIIRRACDDGLKESLKYFNSQYAWLRRTPFKDEFFWFDSLALDDVSRFKYQRLEAPSSVRLLRVFPGSASCKISCELLDVPLKDLASYGYEAISHMPISNAGYNDISVDGHLLWVPSNVYDILHNRRSYWRIKYIWIDSICINDVDIDERSFQARLMIEIYKQASRVIVWLGTAPDALLALKLFEELRYAMNMYCASEADILETYGNEWPSQHWRTLVQLFDHPWFVRVRSIQEVVVATTVHVHYGGMLLRWEDMAFVSTIFCGVTITVFLFHFTKDGDYERTSANTGGNFSIQVLREAYQGGQKIRLYRLLILGMGRKSIEARDHVFSLQGISLDGHGPGLAPDYNLSTEEVFSNAARCILSQEEPFRLLPYAGIGSPRKIKSLPSWVPDFTSGFMFYSLGGVCEESNFYHASGTSPPGIILGPTLNTITMRGMCVDEVSILSSKLETPGPSAILTWLQEARLWAVHHWSAYDKTKSALPEAFWRSLVADQFNRSAYDDRARPAPAKYGACYRVVEQLLHTAATRDDGNNLTLDQVLAHLQTQTSGTDTNVVSKDDMGEWMCDLRLVSMSRRFCITRKGHVGLVPGGSAVGDPVYIFLGLQTPVLIRRQHGKQSLRADEEAYSLVGESYFYGMMDGEMLSEGDECDIVLK